MEVITKRHLNALNWKVRLPTKFYLDVETNRWKKRRRGLNACQTRYVSGTEICGIARRVLIKSLLFWSVLPFEHYFKALTDLFILRMRLNQFLQ